MRRLLYIIAIAAVLASCSRTPRHVIGKSDMAELLADLHVAEGVVDNNQGEYSSDSMKQLLKQSVFERHGVTQEKFDTSLVWYGHHLNDYIDVYDDVISILEKRNLDMGNAVVQMMGSMAGDSVDVWPGSRYARIDDRLPSRMVAFEIDADNNTEPGDVYTWRMKLIDNDQRLVHWTLVAQYDDNSTDWYMGQTGNDDWNEVHFPTDSTMRIKRLRGYFTVDDNKYRNVETDALVAGSREVWIDSISLIRKRLNDDDYRYRVRLRHYPRREK